MEKRLIKTLTITTQQGVSYIEVGLDGITKIVENSLEYPDHVFTQYDAYSGDKLVRTVQNCPVVITWI